MTVSAHAPSAATPALGRVVLALIGVGFSLRTLMAALPPLEADIAEHLHLSGVQVGILTTMPVLAMGLFAPVAARLAHRFGASRVVLGAAALITVGNLLRGVEATGTLFTGTAVAGIGIALAGALMPGLVKRLFPPERAGLATGLSMFAMMSGAALSSAVSVPVAAAVGGWGRSLALWGLVALAGLVSWVPLHRALRSLPPARIDPGDEDHRLPWRSRTALIVASYLVFQSWQFYSSLAWLAPTYVHEGWAAQDAGLLLSAFSAAQLVTGLVAPALADHVSDIRVLILGACAFGLSGELGVWLAPGVAPWVWAVCLGIGQGAAFALGLVLLVKYAVSTRASARFTAMAFLVSYGIASFGPMTMGGIRDLTAGYDAVWMVLALVMVPQILAAFLLRPDRDKVR